MCVYCKEAPDCEHERDSCAASPGERCTERGHDSMAFLPVPPGRGRFTWPPPGRMAQTEVADQGDTDSFNPGKEANEGVKNP